MYELPGLRSPLWTTLAKRSEYVFSIKCLFHQNELENHERGYKEQAEIQNDIA